MDRVQPFQFPIGTTGSPLARGTAGAFTPAFSGGGGPQGPAIARPSFDDHHLDGTADNARRIYSQALADYNPTPEQLHLAADAMAVLGRAQVLLDQQRQPRPVS